MQKLSPKKCTATLLTEHSIFLLMQLFRWEWYCSSRILSVSFVLIANPILIGNVSFSPRGSSAKSKKSWQPSWSIYIESIFFHCICHISALKEWNYSSLEMLCFRPAFLCGDGWSPKTVIVTYSLISAPIQSACGTHTAHTHTGVHTHLCLCVCDYGIYYMFPWTSWDFYMV